MLSNNAAQMELARYLVYAASIAIALGMPLTVAAAKNIVRERTAIPGEENRLMTHSDYGEKCEGGPIPTVELTRHPEHGRVVVRESVETVMRPGHICHERKINGVGVFYIPEPGYVGIDEFAYHRNDEKGNLVFDMALQVSVGEYGVRIEGDPSVKHGWRCDDKNTVTIESVTVDRYGVDGLVGVAKVKFTPLDDAVEYEYASKNESPFGKSDFEYSGTLPAEWVQKGEAEFYISSPGRREIEWTLQRGACKVTVDAVVIVE